MTLYTGSLFLIQIGGSFSFVKFQRKYVNVSIFSCSWFQVNV